MSYIGNPPSQVAFLTDTFSGNGSTTFTMSVAPAGTTSMLVAVTGVVQDPSTYSVVGTTLTFSQAPPTGTANISVRYLGIPASGVTTTAYRTVTEFTAIGGQTTFSVPSYTVGFIDVFRNGVRLGAADFTATNGTTVVLANASSAGELVSTVSFYVSSVLNAIPATAGAVNTTYITDSAVTTAKMADASVTQAKLAANVAGNGPAFSAYLGTNQSISAGTWTKVQINTKEFDTASAFDNTTNYRFQPTVAGYYQVNGQLLLNNSSANYGGVGFNKTGSQHKYVYISNAYGTSAALSALIYLNGTTDYLEMYGFVSAAANTIFAGILWTSFSASFVRAA
jgi:hypothetical protein